MTEYVAMGVLFDYSKPPSSPDWASTHWGVVLTAGVVALFVLVYIDGRCSTPNQRRLLGGTLLAGVVVVAILAMIGASRTAMVLAGGVSVILAAAAPFFAVPQRAEPVQSGSEQTPAEQAPTPESRSVLGDLERLAVLRERGALTDQEFTEQKAKLLA